MGIGTDRELSNNLCLGIAPAASRLLFLCCRLRLSEEAGRELETLACPGLGWDKIKKLAAYHRVAPFLYLNLKRFFGSGRIPDDFAQSLTTIYYLNLQRNCLAEREIIKVLDALKEKNVSVIFLKGFALQYTLYHDLGLRVMCDVDILMKKDDLAVFEALLSQIGYYGGLKYLSPYDLKYQFAANFSKKISQKYSVLIDLHWALLGNRPYELKLPELLERTKSIALEGRKFSSLSQEDAFLFAVLHIRKHLRNLTLDFIVDVAELTGLPHGLDWSYIEKSSRQNRFSLAVYFSLYLARELLKAGLPEEVFKNYRPGMIKRMIIARLVNERNFFAFKNWKATFVRFLLFDSILDYLFYLWRVSFLERFFFKRVLAGQR